MSVYRVPPPNSIQIEPTEGCNLACSFCGIASIRQNGASRAFAKNGLNSAPYRFMSVALAHRIASEMKRLRWGSRIEIAMHGEPTINKALPAIISTFRSALPKAYILLTCNGAGITDRGRFEEVLGCGLNTLALDDYQHANIVPKIRVFAKSLGVPVYEYPNDKRGNPHRRDASVKIVFIRDISLNTDGNHRLHNQGGSSGGPSKEMKRARCAKPFRELAVRWDGNVAICCDDWQGRYKVGNVNEMPLDAIWNHPRFDAARRRLYLGKRDFGPCFGCDVPPNRPGLLPDKMGRDTMPTPDSDTARLIEEALSGDPFTKKVLRK